MPNKYYPLSAPTQDMEDSVNGTLNRGDKKGWNRRGLMSLGTIQNGSKDM